MTTYPQIVSEVRRLPVPARLQLIEEIMRSVRTDLAIAPATPVASAPKLMRGMLKTESILPGKGDLSEEYAGYLIEKYQ